MKGLARLAGQARASPLIHLDPSPPAVLSARSFPLHAPQGESLKQEGNETFARGELAAARDLYSSALDRLPPSSEELRAQCLGNRAACSLRLGENEAAVEDCDAALELRPAYAKVLIRRATAHERLEDLEAALADAQAAAALEPGQAGEGARRAVQRLTPLVEARREKLKDEMMGKLKDLGNSVLGKFGLSLDNFKAEKDPDTGGYSIRYGN